MKPLSPFILILFALVSCNDGKKESVTVTSEDGKTTATIDATSLEKNAEALQKRAEALQKLSPYTLDRMKGFLPEELAGVKRSDLSASSAMGTAFAQASYQLNDSAGIEVNIFDCAGNAGMGIYNNQYLTMMNIQSETDDEYSRTIDLNGIKAFENIKKDGSRSSLTYLAADRLLVTLEGRKTGIEILKKTAGSLSFK